MPVPASRQTNVEEDPHATPALDPESRAGEVSGPASVECHSSAIPREPMAVFPKKSEAAGAKHAGFHSCLSQGRRLAAGNRKSPTT